METGCWREERAEFDAVWEQGDGERIGQNLTVFWNRVLERGVGRVRRRFGTGCWREVRAEFVRVLNRVLETGEEMV